MKLLIMQFLHPLVTMQFLDPLVTIFLFRLKYSSQRPVLLTEPHSPSAVSEVKMKLATNVC